MNAGRTEKIMYIEDLDAHPFVPKRRSGLPPQLWYPKTTGSQISTTAPRAGDVVATAEIPAPAPMTCTVEQLVDAVIERHAERERKKSRVFGMEPDIDEEARETLKSVATSVASDLDETQRAVALDIINGLSGLVTGPGGVGKSHLVRSVRQLLELTGSNVVLTSSTGVAAQNLDSAASTINHFAGLGIGENTPDEQARFSRSKKSRARWRGVDVLVIDEISMISGELLNLIEIAAKHGTGRMTLFGGVQLIMVGDFFQLPPVSKPDKPASWAFESPIWSELAQKVWCLKTSHRQDNAEFFELLSRVRNGSYTSADLEVLKSFSCETDDVGIIPTKLFARRMDVDRINNNELNKLSGEEHPYAASFKATIDVYDPRAGTYTSETAPESDLRNIEIPGRGRTPGITLTVRAPHGDDVDRAFGALVRQTRVSRSLVLKRGAQVIFEVNDDEMGVRNGTRGIVTGFGHGDAPIVELNDGVQVTVQRRDFSSCYKMDGHRRHCVKMSQYPLRLAWALTIHKSQSQSLTKMVADLDNAFEKHQVYVALSRACDPDGLQVLNLDPSTIRVCPKVVKFYEENDI